MDLSNEQTTRFGKFWRKIDAKLMMVIVFQLRSPQVYIMDGEAH